MLAIGEAQRSITASYGGSEIGNNGAVKPDTNPGIPDFSTLNSFLERLTPQFYLSKLMERAGEIVQGMQERLSREHDIARELGAADIGQPVSPINQGIQIHK